MRKYLPYITLLIAVLMIFPAKGQDPYFSQFYNAPLTLNPALTGITYGKIRVGANYRNHLSSFDPFETYAFSIDMSTFQSQLNHDFAGVGMTVVNDVSGYGLKNLKAMFSMAYHKSLNARGTQFISIASQAGIDQTNLNYGNLSTQSQWVADQGVDQSLGNGEQITGDNSVLFDLQAGILYYAFLGKDHVLFLWSAVYHIMEPEKSLLDGNSKLNRRYVAHAGGRIAMGRKTTLIPNFVYMEQNKSQVINSGLMLEYQLSNKKDNQVISAGAWLRNTDAIIINTGLEFKNMQVGVSYDLLISDITTVTQKGGFEISLLYHFKKSVQPVTKLKQNPNPRF